MPEIHLVFSDTGTDRLPGWVERFLRAAGGEDELPQSTLVGVQKIDRDIAQLRGVIMGQFEDLRDASTQVSRDAQEIAAAVESLSGRIDALPDVPPDISDDLATLRDSSAALDAATSELEGLAQPGPTPGPAPEPTPEPTPEPAPEPTPEPPPA